MELLIYIILIKLYLYICLFFRMGCTPSISECDGEYVHEARKNILQWNLPIIDSSNKSGSLEFSCPSSIPGDFFPVNVSFVSSTPYADIDAKDVLSIDEESAVKYSIEKVFVAEKYEIV